MTERKLLNHVTAGCSIGQRLMDPPFGDKLYCLACSLFPLFDWWFVCITCSALPLGIFPLCQFPFGQCWWTGNWQSVWEVMKWEVDKVGIDKYIKDMWCCIYDVVDCVVDVLAIIHSMYFVNTMSAFSSSCYSYKARRAHYIIRHRHDSVYKTTGKTLLFCQ